MSKKSHKPKHATREECLIEIERLNGVIRADRNGHLARSFSITLKTLMPVALAYIGYLCVRELAGKQTDATFSVVAELMANQGFVSTVSIIFGVGGCGVGYASWAVYKSKNEYLAERNRSLEEAVDRQRTSSGLDRSGDTAEGDRP